MLLSMFSPRQKLILEFCIVPSMQLRSHSKVTLLISGKCCVFFPHGVSNVLKESRRYHAVKSALRAKLPDSISPHLDIHWIQVFSGIKKPFLFWYALYWDNSIARGFLIKSLLNYYNLPNVEAATEILRMLQYSKN